jgi:hypothetical protein
VSVVTSNLFLLGQPNRKLRDRLLTYLGPPPIGVRYRCSQVIRDAMRWVRMHNMFLSGTDFWRYLNKAYTSVPGSGGSNPLHAIPCVHGLTQTAWTFYSEGANWKTQLHIEATNDSTRTSCVPSQQLTTMLYRSTTTSCPSD